jgi:hypothetical protein
MMKSLVFLPAYPELSERSLARLAKVIDPRATTPQARAGAARLRRA